MPELSRNAKIQKGHTYVFREIDGEVWVFDKTAGEAPPDKPRGREVGGNLNIVKDYEHVCHQFDHVDIPHRVKSGPYKGKPAFKSRREIDEFVAEHPGWKGKWDK